MNPWMITVMPMRLIGRDETLNTLAAELSRAKAETRLFVITGESGVGKSAIANEVVQAAAAQWRVVRTGTRPEETAPSLWPLLQVSAELGVAFVEGVDPLGKMVDALSRVVSVTGNTLILLEDLQWADLSTLRALGLLLQGPRLPLAIVATLRDEARPRRGDAAAELHALIRRGTEVAIEGLDKASVSELFAEASGRPPLPVLEEDIWRATAGNPYFVIELARSMKSVGDVHRPDLSRGFRIPAGISQIVEDRLAVLSLEIVETLRWGAVIGERFPLNLLGRVTGRPTIVIDHLDEAQRENVIGSPEPGVFSFSHVMLREHLYESTPASDRRRMHGVIANALAGTDRETSLQEMADHRFKELDPERVDETMELLTQAARRAVDLGSTEIAHRNLVRALKVAHAFGRTSDIAALEAELGELTNAGASATTADESKRSPAGLQREGDVWLVTYNGRSTRLRHSLGLKYLATLLASPGQEFHSIELASDGTADVSAGEQVVDPLLDPQAKSAYRRRLAELREDLEEAEAFNDMGRVAKLRAEVDLLTSELSAALGLGGRDRRLSSTSERARVSVTRATRSAIGKIDAALPRLGEHLRASVRTGTFVSYSPGTVRPRWEIKT